jgi:hypothetical protein
MVKEKIKLVNKHPFLTFLGIILLIIILLRIFFNNSISGIETEDKTFVVQKGYVWYTCYNSTNDLEINAEINSINPVDVYFTPSENDVKLFVNNSAFNHYPSCHSPSILNDKISCVTSGNSCIILSNLNGIDNTQVNLKLYSD